MYRLNLLVGVVFASGMLAQEFAMAYDPCQAYAENAIFQQRQNHDLNCQYNGSHWHGDQEKHRNFCKSAGLALAGQYDRKRREALQQCVSPNHSSQTRSWNTTKNSD